MICIENFALKNMTVLTKITVDEYDCLTKRTVKKYDNKKNNK
jgi:hypothetical protein